MTDSLAPHTDVILAKARIHLPKTSDAAAWMLASASMTTWFSAAGVGS